SPSSTTVDQDAPSPSKSQTTPKTQPPVIPHDVEEDNHDIEAQAPLFLWAEAVATACYTQNRSIVRLHHGKTPYELLDGQLLDRTFLHVLVHSVIQLMTVRI
nr:retrovirus-related Pol polyprotein from transposon TNT 1-94 [Tanacetum cinerariifolium]